MLRMSKTIRKNIFYLPKLHLLHISIYVYTFTHSLNEVSPLRLVMPPQEPLTP